MSEGTSGTIAMFSELCWTQPVRRAAGEQTFLEINQGLEMGRPSSQTR